MIDRQRVWTVMRKDWLELRRNKQVMFSLIIVPTVFAVVLPLSFISLGKSSALSAANSGLDGMIENLPQTLVPAGLNLSQVIVFTIIVYFMAPFFLVIPVLISNITAASSFVGEKERTTIEGLLYTPVTNRELVVAKVLASLIPTIGLSWFAFLVYTLIANTLGTSVVGIRFFPTTTWVLLVLIVVPLISMLSTSLIVAISSRASTMQGAQGMAMFIVLPILAIVISQTTGLILFDYKLIVIAAPVLLILDVLAFVFVVARFNRERIVTRL